MSAGVKHELPALPFSHADLAPVISAQTVELHHGKHHAAYFGKLNDLIPGTKYEDMGLEDIVKASRGVDQGIFNQAGQAWNHIQYWDALKPGGSKAPTASWLNIWRVILAVSSLLRTNLLLEVLESLARAGFG